MSLSIPFFPRWHQTIIGWKRGWPRMWSRSLGHRVGTLTPQQVWGEMARDMAQGEPLPGELGLDRTHTWASTYWGGALFCLMADIAIREKTGNQKGCKTSCAASLPQAD